MTQRILLAVLAVVLFLSQAQADDGDALRRYVDAPDDAYQYTVRQRVPLGDAEGVEVTLTSQTWRGITWKHQLYLIKPRTVTAPRQAVLVIAGGRWRDRYDALPTGDGSDLPRKAQLFAGLAERFGSPVAVLLQVPFQPIFGNLHEDAAIAYTFDQYLNSNEDDWPLLLPMVKAAVRAMDTTQAIARDEWGLDVERFTVTGASKRGWTTWLTGAVDDRAVTIAPMVIDMLNLGPQMHHQLEAWGAFSAMIHDYTELNIIDRLQEPAGQRLVSIVDPYAYRDALTMPKLIVLGTNDPYWPVDALNLYWDQLPGEERILYVPNAGHGLETGLVSVISGVIAAHRAAVGQLTLPVIDWTMEESDDTLVIRVTSDRAPQLVQAWFAQTATRDFRDSVWASQPLAAEDGRYVFTLPRPAAGHVAAYVDLVYRDGDLPYNLTTQLRVIGPVK